MIFIVLRNENGHPLQCFPPTTPLYHTGLLRPSVVSLSCVCGGGGEGWFLPFHPVHTSIPAQPNPAPLSEYPIPHPVSVYSDPFSSELRLNLSAHLFPRTPQTLVISIMYVAYSPMRLEGS